MLSMLMKAKLVDMFMRAGLTSKGLSALLLPDSALASTAVGHLELLTSSWVSVLKLVDGLETEVATTLTPKEEQTLVNILENNGICDDETAERVIPSPSAVRLVVLYILEKACEVAEVTTEAG